MSGRVPFAAALVLAGVACSRSGPSPEASAWRMRPLSAPAAPGSGEPNLAAAPDGRLFLTWIERRGELSALRFATRRAGEPWSEARTVAQGADFFVNWADFPSLLALDARTLLAHWLAKNGGGSYGYDVRVSRSRDGGATWEPYVVPHRDRTRTEHGFVSMTPWPGGGAGLFWLDGRQTGDAADAGGAGMALAHAVLGTDGRAGPDSLLDQRACDCCQTAAARTDRGVVVVYRDRSPTEVRDMAVVRFENGSWTEPRPLHDDGWEMNGCPVNGPAVAAAGARVAVAWFTAAADRPRVRLAFSNDGGARFAPPLAVDDGRPLGRVDVVLLRAGEALVSWLEQGSDGTELKVRRFDDQGPRGPSFRVAPSSSARSSGFPRLELAGAEPVVAWRDVQEPARVQTAVLEPVG